MKCIYQHPNLYTEKLITVLRTMAVYHYMNPYLLNMNNGTKISASKHTA